MTNKPRQHRRRSWATNDPHDDDRSDMCVYCEIRLRAEYIAEEVIPTISNSNIRSNALALVNSLKADIGALHHIIEDSITP